MRPDFLAQGCLVEATIVHSLFDLENTPGLLSILAGKPNTTTFPILSISLDAPSLASASDTNIITLEGEQIGEALQYGTTSGQLGLIDLLTRFQCELHGRQKDPSWKISIGAGSADLLYQATKTLTDPGDAVLEVGLHTQ